jgi:hypothetical protein
MRLGAAGAVLSAVLFACSGVSVYEWANLYSKGPIAPVPEIARFETGKTSKAPALRPIYPLSVIAGGAYDAAELKNRLLSDPVAARHYSQFQLARVTRISAHSLSRVYVSYRKGDAIYWTSRPVRLAEGEALLTDGVLLARARCGNRISPTPMLPVARMDPPPGVLDIPKYWLPEMAALLPPPAAPEESRERSAVPVGAFPGSPLVASKRNWWFPLIPIPILIATHHGGHGNPGTPATPPPVNPPPVNPPPVNPPPVNPPPVNPPPVNPPPVNPPPVNPPPVNPPPVNPPPVNPPPVNPPPVNPPPVNPPPVNPPPVNPPPVNPPPVNPPPVNPPPVNPPPVTPVPEPSSVVFLLVALLALGGAHYWRQRSSHRS